MSSHWLRSRWRTRGEYAGVVLRFVRGFIRAHWLAVVGILVALFAYYFVLG